MWHAVMSPRFSGAGSAKRTCVPCGTRLRILGPEGFAPTVLMLTHTRIKTSGLGFPFRSRPAAPFPPIRSAGKPVRIPAENLGPEGFEPSTPRLKGECSTPELRTLPASQNAYGHFAFALRPNLREKRNLSRWGHVILAIFLKERIPGGGARC
jgi:hypothetical protein